VTKPKKPVSAAEKLRQKKLSVLKTASRIEKIRRTFNVGGQKMQISLPKMSWDKEEVNNGDQG
jgi:hypothetical protein